MDDNRTGLDAVDFTPEPDDPGGIRWGALALESLVVVVSILLAFGLESWWEGRQELELADDLREALVVDFQATRSTIDSVQARTERNLTAANSLLVEAFVGDTEVPVDTLVTRYLSMARLWPLLATNGTYASAVSSGDIRLLRNDSLTAALADFQEFLTFLQVQDRVVEEVVVAGAFARGSRELGGLVSLQLSLHPGRDFYRQADFLTREEFVERLRTPEVLAGIEGVLVLEQTRVGLLASLRERIDGILRLLGEDLGRSVMVVPDSGAGGGPAAATKEAPGEKTVPGDSAGSKGILPGDRLLQGDTAGGGG